jgi:hypothetical protein
MARKIRRGLRVLRGCKVESELELKDFRVIRGGRDYKVEVVLEHKEIRDFRVQEHKDYREFKEQQEGVVEEVL